MLNTSLIKSFTDMRLDPSGLSKLASELGPVYILHRNKPRSVLLDVLEYERIVEELQDHRDSLWLRDNEEKFKQIKGIKSEDMRAKYNLTA
jgi:PHD/YefM family antitoxin component YafN of YafNO toxin-antitoxin module